MTGSVPNSHKSKIVQVNTLASAVFAVAKLTSEPQVQDIDWSVCT